MNGIFSFYGDMFSDGWFGIGVAIVITVLLLIILSVILVGAFELLDTACIRTIRGQGKVTAKCYEKAHSEEVWSWNFVLKIPQLQHERCPPAWFLTISIGNDTGEVEVDNAFYRKIAVGNVVGVQYGRSRFSKTIVIRDVW